MSSVAPVSDSVQRLNEVVQMASAKTIDAAKKQVEVAVALSLGQEPGKGGLLDAVA